VVFAGGFGKGGTRQSIDKARSAIGLHHLATYPFGAAGVRSLQDTGFRGAYASESAAHTGSVREGRRRHAGRVTPSPGSSSRERMRSHRMRKKYGLFPRKLLVSLTPTRSARRARLSRPGSPRRSRRRSRSDRDIPHGRSNQTVGPPSTLLLIGYRWRATIMQAMPPSAHFCAEQVDGGVVMRRGVCVHHKPKYPEVGIPCWSDYITVSDITDLVVYREWYPSFWTPLDTFGEAFDSRRPSEKPPIATSLVAAPAVS
jgi:hypothetical protein